MAKQSREDRLKRLSKGQCPIHGTFMFPDYRACDDSLVRCPRKDCKIQGRLVGPRETMQEGPVELLPGWEPLVGLSRKVTRREEYRGRTIAIYQVIDWKDLEVDIRVQIGEEDVTWLIESMGWLSEDWIEGAKTLLYLKAKPGLVDFLSRV